MPVLYPPARRGVQVLLASSPWPSTPHAYACRSARRRAGGADCGDAGPPRRASAPGDLSRLQRLRRPPGARDGCSRSTRACVRNREIGGPAAEPFHRSGRRGPQGMPPEGREAAFSTTAFVAQVDHQPVCDALRPLSPHDDLRRLRQHVLAEELPMGGFAPGAIRARPGRPDVHHLHARIADRSAGRPLFDLIVAAGPPDAGPRRAHHARPASGRTRSTRPTASSAAPPPRAGSPELARGRRRARHALLDIGSRRTRPPPRRSAGRQEALRDADRESNTLVAEGGGLVEPLVERVQLAEAEHANRAA